MSYEEPELWQSKLLLRALRLDESGLSRLPPPEPDTQWVGSGRRIGIEVTDLNPGGQRARQESGARQQLLKAAGAIYASLDQPPVLVHVDWELGFVPDKKRDAALPQELADVVQRHHPGALGRIQLDTASDPAPWLPAGVAMVSILGVPSGPSGFFSYEYETVPVVTPEVIQLAVDRKRDKPLNYTKRYDDLWLLLVLGGGGRGTWGLVDPTLGLLTVQSPFHRVFVFSPFELRVFELSRRP